MALRQILCSFYFYITKTEYRRSKLKPPNYLTIRQINFTPLINVNFTRYIT